MMASVRSNSKKLVVAALDFGTTYSGFAFSTTGQFEEDPLKISTNVNWIGGDIISQKTPTVLLLGPRKEFIAFGYDAEDKYSQLASENKHKQYYFFRRFKMKLYDSESLNRSTKIEGESKQSLEAIVVFSHCIKFLHDEFMKTVKTKVTDVSEDDIDWVLTVPAIWNDSSKQFMREAAVRAGIQTNALTIALEPEAASLYCMQIPVQASPGGKQGASNFSASVVSSFRTGNQYMVVDVGGGTVDITVHEVVGPRKLKEIVHASGGAWGGTRVDAAFQDFLEELLGQSVMQQFKDEFMEDWVDLQRQFEAKKRSVKNDKEDKETLNIPLNLATVLQKHNKTFQQQIENNEKFKKKVKYVKGKFRVDCTLVHSWFSESCKSTVGHMKALFAKENCVSVKTILLVGGFADSQILQDAIRGSFGDKRVIIPNDAGLVVLKGAVLFGHDPLTITHRVAKVTYGIRVFKAFERGTHPVSKLEIIDKVEKCKDIFSIHVTKGQILDVSKPQNSQEYTPLEADQISLQFDIFSSTKEKPEFTDEPGCTYIGQLEVDFPGHGKGRVVLVQMTYGGTEVTVTGSIKGTNITSTAKLDFMHK